MTGAGPPASTPDATHGPDATSWVDTADGHPDFPVQNLPFGVFAPRGPGHDDAAPRGGIRIGDQVLDLRGLAGSGLLAGDALAGAQAAAGSTLNAFFGRGPGVRRALRTRVHTLLTQAEHRATVAPLLHDIDAVETKLPAAVGDYTDFYAGIHHAHRVGELFRPDRPLLPNYRWVPIAYHGRASSVQVSGQPVRRPRGQLGSAGEDAPRFAPTEKLDFELELGVWIGSGNAAGEPIPIGAAAEHIAGFGLLNDWSARDIQSWEYQPLGPFLGKSFATTVSPWVVTAEALAPYRIPAPARGAGDPVPLPYLTDPTDQAGGGLDIDLEVLIRTADMTANGAPPQRVSLSSSRHLYWTVAQMVAHHSSNGCNLRAGDLFGTGTISGPDAGSYGSLLEITGNGRVPLQLATGESRTFLQNGDEVLLRARAQRPGLPTIGFGDCRAAVVAAGAG
jgi:fumarylacetoacetase